MSDALRPDALPPDALPPDALPQAAPPPEVPAPDSRARPHFTRPAAVVTNEVVVGRPAPTSAVAKARPTLPAVRRRPSARMLGAGAAGLLLFIAATVTLVVWRGADASSPHRAAAVRPVPAPPVPTLPPQSPIAHISHPAGASTAPSVGTLRALDSTRSRAFATRDTALLRRVYVAGPLRAADAAALMRLVPRGCGLRGVRTDYRAVTSRVSGGVTVLTARASLPRSQLVCSGHVVRTAAAVAPTRLQITLVAHAGTVLIAAERTLV